MSHSRISDFFSKPETDDTLQNIRRDYLASKKNLQELMTTSPTRIPIKQARGNQLPTPPLHKNETRNDEHLRQQIRQGLQSDRSPLRLPTMSPRQDSYSVDMAHLRRMINDQQRQIEELSSNLRSQNMHNQSLQERVAMLESYIGNLEEPRHHTRRYSYIHSAPSSSGTSSEAYSHQSKAELENTRYLLDMSPTKQQRRHFSNFEDSTTKLIQLAQNPSKR